MRRLRPLAPFLVIAAIVGLLLPFAITISLFSTTVQGFVAGPQPTPGFWSGAPTPVPTAIPSAAQVWTRSTFSAAGGAVFLLWSVLGALAGAVIAARRGDPWNRTRNAWLGAVAGSLVFFAVAVCGFLR